MTISLRHCVQNKAKFRERETYYPKDDRYNWYNRLSEMAPFTKLGSIDKLQNYDGMSNVYTREFYHYEARPSCPKCGSSKYLFCDKVHGKAECVSKIKPGGNCQGFEGQEGACWMSICKAGKCASQVNTQV